LVALTRKLGDATKDLNIPIISQLTFPPPWFGGGIGPHEQIASVEALLRDDFSPNYNVGLLWEPWSWLSLGGVYQSPITAELGGRYRVDYSDQFQRMVNWFGSSPLLLEISGMLDLPTSGVPTQTGRVSGKLEFPQRVQGGIMLKPFRWLRLLTDIHWADWSVVDVDELHFDQDLQLLKIVKVLGYTGGNRTLVTERHWKDTWEPSYGIELRPLERVALRAGYQKRKSAVPDRFFDLLLRLPDVKLYTGGIGITLEDGTEIDLGGVYMVGRRYRIPNNGSVNLNSTDPFRPVYNPYAGLDYEQDTISYSGTLTVTFPMDVFAAMLDHQAETLHKIMSLLNPFD
jgi:long-subunit fatty acid transport protein